MAAAAAALQRREKEGFLKRGPKVKRTERKGDERKKNKSVYGRHSRLRGGRSCLRTTVRMLDK